MTDFEVDASITIDPSTPFCAYTYYTGLRAEGGNPFVANGGLYQSVTGGSKTAREFNEWATRHDTDGALRLEYARAMWATRASNDAVILLGAQL